MEQKLYANMTPDEQLRYVTDLTTFIDQKLPVLEHIGDAWERSSRKDMETGLQLLAAFQFARDFVDRALRYGDYAARVNRIRVYIEKIKKEISAGLTLRGSDGHTYALVAPTVPQRRRGRPTAAEAEARRNGLAVPRPTDVAMQKQITIARLLGIEVIVTPDAAPREKNNAELAAERAAKQAAYDRQNPSLFSAPTPSSIAGDSIAAPTAAVAEASANGPAPSSAPSGSPAGISAPSSAPSGSPAGITPCAALLSDAYALRMSQDKLHLNQLAWLLTPDLAARTETVQSLRVTAESASERAKTLADFGQPADVIAPYAQQAKEATESYLAIYAAVDEELAVLHRRLYLDLPYVENFKARFRGVDIEKVQHITRPYYEKLKSPDLDLRIKTMIEQDNPAYAAQMKAEEERKREVADILRYLKRKDKPNVAQRIRTMETRYARLITLLGETEARVYRPIVDAAIADYEQNHKKETPSQPPRGEGPSAKKAPSSSIAGDSIAAPASSVPAGSPAEKNPASSAPAASPSGKRRSKKTPA